MLTQYKIVALIEIQGNKEVVFTDGYNSHEFRIGGEKFVNMADTIWQAIAALRAQQTKQATVDGVKVTTKEFNGKWILNMRRLDMNGKFTKDGFCLSVDSIDALEEIMHEMCDIVTPAVEFVKQQPLFFRVILFVLYILTEKQVQLIATEHCQRCSGTTRTLIGDFHTFCLMLTGEKMKKFSQDALKKVQTDQVVCAVTEYCKIHHIPQNRLLNKFIDRAMKSYTLYRLLNSPQPPAGDNFNDVVASVARTQP